MIDWSKYAVGGASARPDSFTGLHPDMQVRLAQMLMAADEELGPGALRITSAYRSPEVQAALYDAALKKYGSEAEARKWVAPPGRSQHNKGTAVDFAGSGGGLLRDPNSREAIWLRENAARFGLAVPMDWEPWQVELEGARSGTSSPLDRAPSAPNERPTEMRETFAQEYTPPRFNVFDFYDPYAIAQKYRLT